MAAYIGIILVAGACGLALLVASQAGKRRPEPRPMPDPHRGAVALNDMTDRRGNRIGGLYRWRCACASYGTADSEADAWVAHGAHVTARLLKAAR